MTSRHEVAQSRPRDGETSSALLDVVGGESSTLGAPLRSSLHSRTLSTSFHESGCFHSVGRSVLTASFLEPSQPGGDSTIFGATLIMICSIVGSGIVGLPVVFRLAGFYSGLGLIFLASSLTGYSLVLLVETGTACGIDTYESLAEHAFGKPGAVIVALSLICYDYGAMLTYLVILGSMAESVLKISFGLDRTSWWVQSHALRRISMIALSTLVTLPLCFMRDISSLEKASGVSIASTCIVTIMIATKMVFLADTAALHDFHDRFTTIGPGMFQAFSIACFAFVCQDTAFLVFGALREKTKRNYRATASSGMIGSVMISMVLAVTGFLSFGPETCPDILDNYAGADKVIIVARALYMCVMTLVYPISFFVVRHICNVTFLGGDLTCTMPAGRFLVLTLGLWCSSVVITSFVFDLSAVMSLTGAFGAVTLAFILPPLMHIKLSYASPIRALGCPWGWLSLFICFFGLMAMGGSVYQTIMHTNPPPARCSP